MNIQKKEFFDYIRGHVFPNTMTQGQVEGVEAIVDEFQERQLTDLRWLAYMLATAKWETAHTMQPIAEYGKGSGRPYGLEDQITHQAYYGRGLVQLTWKTNYEKMGKLLGVDLLNHPDKAMEMEIAVQIMFEGMLKLESGVGDFTNHCLEEFFNETREDWMHARTIINGMDKAAEIAEIAHQFYNGLKFATQITTLDSNVHSA